MPTYDFACPNGHDFEKFFRSIANAASELPCPVCGAAAVRKVSGGAGLLFKGSGFYITDYGKDGKKDQRAASKPAATKPAAEGGSADASAPAPVKDTPTGGSDASTPTQKPAAPPGGAPAKSE